MAHKLKPCPFCGGEAVQKTSYDCDHDAWHFVGCSKCGFGKSVMGGRDAMEAAGRWNTRI